MNDDTCGDKGALTPAGEATGEAEAVPPRCMERLRIVGRDDDDAKAAAACTVMSWLPSSSRGGGHGALFSATSPQKDTR